MVCDEQRWDGEQETLLRPLVLPAEAAAALGRLREEYLRSIHGRAADALRFLKDNKSVVDLI